MITGFADLHNHQFANLGFGGLAFWGAPFGEIQKAQPWCTPAHGPGGVGDVLGNLIAGTYGGPAGVGHRVSGHPEFGGWPRWNSVSHQAVYEDWLHRAVRGGLRLLIMLAVNNEPLCSMANRAHGRSCDEMEAVDLQLAGAKAMEAHMTRKVVDPGGAGIGSCERRSRPSGKPDFNSIRRYWIKTEDGTADGYTYRGGRKNARGLTDLARRWSTV